MFKKGENYETAFFIFFTLLFFCSTAECQLKDTIEIKADTPVQIFNLYSDTPFSCENFKRKIISYNIKKLYIGDRVMVLDSCWCSLKQLESIGINIGNKYRGTSNSDTIPFCVTEMPNLHYLDIYGIYIKNDGVAGPSIPVFEFDLWKMSNLDTLIIKGANLHPKMREIQLNSLKYLDMGVGEYSQLYAIRLRKKLYPAEVKISHPHNNYKATVKKDIYPLIYNTEFDTFYKKAVWYPKYFTIDMCYLPTKTMRFSLGVQNYFNKYKDKHGGNYTGGTHIINFNVGVIITPKHSTKIGVELRYDYNLPHFPLFFGIGFNAYTDVKTADFRVYARPRIGITPFPILSFWYSQGIPLAKTAMENVPIYEIGITVFFKPVFLFVRRTELGGW